VPRVSRRTALLAAAGLAAAACATAIAFALTHSSGPEPPPGAPNIVLILTDDQRWDTLQSMPTVQQQLVRRGITFENAFVVNPLCCPSRASILTGQYSHSTGVYSNGGPHGGFKAFRDSSTIATWLDDAGYETGLFGKYLNRYGGTYIPPGWDRWFAFSGRSKRPRPAAYFNYTVNDGGELVRMKGADNYSTDVLAREAVSFIHESDRPLFLYFSTAAPHIPSPPPPRYANAFADLPPFRPKSYDEPDFSDKPGWLQSLPRLDATQKTDLDALRKDKYRALLGVDDAVRQIIAALRDTGRLHNTLILFMSDNGESLGEHRWTSKSLAYEEDIRVPFVLRWDAKVATAGTDDRLVANIDVAPTFAAAAGVQAPAAEGRSVLPMDPGSWRDDFLVEHLPLATDDPKVGGAPGYCAVRNTQFLYVAYSNREEELYDLHRDPFELENVAGDAVYASDRAALRKRLLELCDPPPPGVDFSWLSPG
jgi:N-acetylglucosamine-6-sulfatase